MTTIKGRGRRKLPLTIFIENSLDSQGSHYFKLEDVAASVSRTCGSYYAVLPARYTPSFIARQVRRIASQNPDGQRVWVAIPNKTGEKWWKRLSACVASDIDQLVNYRDRQIDALMRPRKEMAIILKMQFAAAEQGIVLTYGEALAQLEQEK